MANLGDERQPSELIAFFNNPESQLIEIDQPIDPRLRTEPIQASPPEAAAFR